MTNNIKEQYRALCEQEKTISLYSQSWWLDIICGRDGWDVVTVVKNNEIYASLPYMREKKYKLFKAISQPKINQSLGVWMRNEACSPHKKLGNEKELMTELIENLPNHDIFCQHFSPDITNWLPFYWKGFEQTTRYTYRLNKQVDLWDNLAGNIKREIKKAKNRYHIKVEESDDVESFINLNIKTYDRQAMKMPYRSAYFSAVIRQTLDQKKGKLYIARGEDGQAHAAAFIVTDHSSAYYIAGAGDPDLRNSGAASLCLWHAIESSFGDPNITLFDFEGSMVEGIERFFRGFGAEPIAYYRVLKISSKPLAILESVKSVLKAIL